MDVVGSEIGQKMRSAIKAKLTELGCYVDDELPDYVMVMVANKRTRSQMEDDLQLFLGDNTELFVNWLHQVLKKLQEVTVAAPIKTTESEIITKERSTSKERKSKEKKEKSKKSDSSKKSKKKAKEKIHKKKDEKKKNKKKSKHEMIRPNIPPLLMNIEKESEPSITDVFAGQILKNHGIILETHKEESKIEEQKPIVAETKRPIIPIIDPASIPSQTEDSLTELNTPDTIETVTSVADNVEVLAREDKIKEMNEIEAKIEGLKQKLADQLDSTDDEDFLNIRTEADELINDFAEDVFKEIPQPLPTVTPPLRSRKSRSPTLSPTPPLIQRKEVPKDIPETLPQIELNLPKRPIRERLGAPTQKKDGTENKEKSGKTTDIAERSPERYTPEKEPVRPHLKSAKSRLGGQQVRPETHRKSSTSDESEQSENSSRRLTSRVSVLENRSSRVSCASVVRVRPRPRVSAPASSLLLRAVADAHKSLLNIPPKVDPEPQKVKRALVLPMRRCVDPKKIVIQVPCNETSNSTPADSISDNISLGEDLDSEVEDKSPKTASNSTDKEEYTPIAITKVIQNTEYVPSRTLIRRDDKVFVETINIHNTTVDKDKKTQFIVTMDGYHPNAFLAKKLMTEGLLNDDEEVVKKPKESDKTEKSKNENPLQSVLINVDNDGTKEVEKDILEEKTTDPPILSQIQTSDEKNEYRKEQAKEDSKKRVIEKRKSDSSLEKPVEKRKSDIVEKSVTDKRNDDFSIEKPVVEKTKPVISVDKPILEKRKSDISLESTTSQNDQKNSPPVKKRKASPIIFDVHKKEKEVDRVRERTLSASSDSHVVLTTVSNTHKYDTLPPLSQASKAVWCRAFPLCRYGAACAFAHPRCKFAAACTRRGCVYSHALSAATVPSVPALPVVASHVVPAANYKSISAAAFANICKFYPSCSNPACHYYHPKPCRYGKACANKLECNFYHHDVPGGKWKYSV